AVELLEELVRRASRAVELDRSVVKIPRSRRRRPIGEILNPFRAIRDVAPDLEAQVSDRRRRIGAMRTGEREGPERHVEVERGVADDLEVEVVVLAHAIALEHRIVIEAQDLRPKLEEETAHVLAIALGAGRCGIRIGWKEVHIAEAIGILLLEPVARLRELSKEPRRRLVSKQVARDGRMVAVLGDGLGKPRSTLVETAVGDEEADVHLAREVERLAISGGAIVHEAVGEPHVRELAEALER